MSGAPPVTAEGFVLAGGRSSRMGRDKSLLRVNGRALIEAALETLRALPLTVPPRIAGARADLAPYAPVLEDLHPGCGPLSGMETALAATASPYNVFLPVDLPLVPPRFLAWMLERAACSGANATFPRIHGRPQPLCGVYHCDALPCVRQALAAGEYSVIRSFARGAEGVDIFDLEMLASTRPEIYGFSPLPIARWFLNCNSPGEIASLAAAVR